MQGVFLYHTLLTSSRAIGIWYFGNLAVISISGFNAVTTPLSRGTADTEEHQHNMYLRFRNPPFFT